MKSGLSACTFRISQGFQWCQHRRYKQIAPLNLKEPELIISQVFLALDYSSFVGDVTTLALKTYARNLQFILAWNIHNILYGERTDKMWNFDVIPRALIRFGNLNNDGHKSLITSSYFTK